MKQDLIRRVEDKLIESLLLAQKKFNRTFELPKLSFDVNSGKIAGLAHYYNWTIRINYKFLELHPEQIIGFTITHELSHLLTHKLFPNHKQHHGPEFRSVCRALGIETTTYHSMQLPESRPHTYICNCQKFFLSNLVHRRIQAGSLRACRNCGKVVVYLNSK